MTLKDRLVEAIQVRPGQTDRQLADRLLGRGRPQQAVNQAARQLEARGLVVRRRRADGLLGNYPASEDKRPTEPPPSRSARRASTDAPQSEDEVKAMLKDWLEGDGWTVQVRWGRERGIDIDARRGVERRIIEVKGCGSRSAMRVNYFLGALGELLQRMDDPTARYSIALPDMRQFRGLWERLPTLARNRTQITALFVQRDGSVDEQS